MQEVRNDRSEREGGLTDERHDGEEEQDGGVSPEEVVDESVEDGDGGDDGGEEDLGGEDAQTLRTKPQIPKYSRVPFTNWGKSQTRESRRLSTMKEKRDGGIVDSEV